MLLVPLVAAPLVVAAATLIERRLGPSAAGWVAALPASFSVALLAVAVDAGTRSAGAIALSAATHVPAQVAFAVVFAAAMLRRGPLAGLAAGTAAYVACSVWLAGVTAAAAVALAGVALALAPRAMAGGTPRPASRRGASATTVTCVAAAAIVGVVVLTSRLAGPEVAGAVGAFPTISATLAVAVAARDGRRAGAHALTGLVRSLPCYLAFCLVVALAAPALGVAAVALGLLTCVGAAGVTWRGVAIARRPAVAITR